ncbi:MAG TPA: (2Fe-2S)-binding protein [Candidatus Micrarchaeaceae archaeon]|nr:(2Fe-2S)-binding protein [Candidatus Micrarchaeaceae archaeon]
MLPLRLTVNGEERTDEVEPRLLLVHYLREVCGLTGSHVGCDTSQCGACTVLLNGAPVKSCNLLAVQAEGAQVTTIEGLAPAGQLHPLQAAFREHHALQCGYCTPGFIMAASALLADNPDPDDAQISRGLEGNLCRCTGYVNIRQAVKAAGLAQRRGDVVPLEG